jgi:hypothetical protein
MDPIRSLDEPDPVQRYMRRQALVRGAIFWVVVVVAASAAYRGIFR